MDKQSFKDLIEAQSRSAFGSPEERKRKTHDYINDIVERGDELLVRQVLDALSRLPDFIPASGLLKKGVFEAPLDELLAPFVFPQFKLSIVSSDDLAVVAEVAEGIPMAGRGSRFYFRRSPTKLELERRENLDVLNSP